MVLCKKSSINPVFKGLYHSVTACIFTFKFQILKRYILFTAVLIFLNTISFAQTDSFDVFKYHTPDFFIKSELPSRVQFSMKNNDTSFCLITLYKSLPAQEDVRKDVMAQWKEYVLKPLSKADKKPGRIYTQQLWDGWVSTVAIGNFYQNKKKCVVMLSSFRKNKTTVCASYAFSSNIFKGPVENFSQQLHLQQ